MYDWLNHAVPTDTQAVLQRYGARCQNLGLILARYIPWEAIDNQAEVPSNVNPPPRRGQKWRDYWLQEVCKRFDVETNNTDWKRLQDNLYRRWQATVNGASVFYGTLQSRLIVGLGGKGPLEFGLTLQFISGLPSIPGSAIKGIARSYALLTLAEKLNVPLLDPITRKRYVERDEATPIECLEALLLAKDDDIRSEALAKLNRSRRPVLREAVPITEALLAEVPDTDHFRHAFGDTDSSGECIFFESVIAQLPSSGTLFEVDVMTPHFSDYYGNPSVPPHDGHDPIPVNFLAVRPDTTFAFAVRLCKRHTERILEERQKTLVYAVDWLKEGLDILGAGAKTAAGYGAFSIKS